MPPPPSIESSGTAVAPGSAPPRALPDEPGWALFLDLDGTLCHYRSDPAEVALDEAQRALLRSLALRLAGALCVLSGRAPDDLDRALGDLPVPRRAGHGAATPQDTDAATRQALAAAGAALESLATLHPGTWCEHKPAGCALHYRDAPHFAERLTEEVRRGAERWPELRLLEGRCVLEFIPLHASKAHALRALMQAPPFAGRLPVVAGDDVTDEDAFVAAAALGGFGIAVGSRRSPAARYRLHDPDALDGWLRGLAFSPEEPTHA
jgi:trehalose 6-phosphate phosphatase